MRVGGVVFKLLHCAAALMCCVWAGLSLAQGYPNRPITFIFPYPSGAALEGLLRQLHVEVSKQLGQPIVFENRPGANTRLGINAIRQAKPDGYTLTFATDSILVHQPLADPEFKLEPGKDYVPVTFLTRNLLVFAANPAVPFRDVKGLIAYAKANPGKLNVGFGAGSPLHFAAEFFRQRAGIDVAMIPYRGTPDALTALLAGQVDLEFGSATFKPHVDSGKLVALATSGQERWDMFPSVPTLVESGVQMVQSTWGGVLAPANTPPDIVQKLYSAYNSALRLPEIAKRFQELAFIPDVNMSPNDFGALVKSETELWRPIIQKAGIKLQ